MVRFLQIVVMVAVSSAVQIHGLRAGLRQLELSQTSLRSLATYTTLTEVGEYGHVTAESEIDDVPACYAFKVKAGGSSAGFSISIGQKETYNGGTFEFVSREAKYEFALEQPSDSSDAQVTFAAGNIGGATTYVSSSYLPTSSEFTTYVLFQENDEGSELGLYYIPDMMTSTKLMSVNNNLENFNLKDYKLTLASIAPYSSDQAPIQASIENCRVYDSSWKIFCVGETSSSCVSVYN